MKCILSIDQGTTGTTACLINAENFKFIDKVNKEFEQIFPSPGWVEHNLNSIWETVEETIKEVLRKNNIQKNQIISIGITNQRETTCAFDRDGNPLSNAIVWQDRRTSKYCETIKSRGIEDKIKKKTGLPLDPYFSGSKMNWLLNNNPNVIDAYKNGNLLFGTIDSFLLFKLTGNNSHKTEASNASRTLLMNLEDCKWDNELLDIFEVPKDSLPEICDSFSSFGDTKNLGFLPDGIPITGILGDQQSALFGQAGFNKGDIKCTYGTGAFMLLNTGNQIQYSNSGLLSTVAYLEEGKPVYALEGSSYIAGAAVQWLRDNLNIVSTSPEIESLAKSVDLQKMENLLFLPFFSGIGSPHWLPDAKAAIIGITRDTSKEHLAHACLDGIVLSINDLLLAMKKDADFDIKELRVDGGAVGNNLLMKMQSSASNVSVIRPNVIETTAYGAALASAIGAGIFEKEQISELWKEDRAFTQDDKLQRYYKNKVIDWNTTIHKLYK